MPAQGLEVVVADGEYVVRDGDRSTDMYIVVSGAVEISKEVGGGRVKLGHIERGDFFGEMSLLEGVPRQADARAVGETRLLVITKGSLLVRLRRDPTFALEMLQRLSRRLREANARLDPEVRDSL